MSFLALLHRVKHSVHTMNAVLPASTCMFYAMQQVKIFATLTYCTACLPLLCRHVAAAVSCQAVCHIEGLDDRGKGRTCFHSLFGLHTASAAAGRPPLQYPLTGGLASVW